MHIWFSVERETTGRPLLFRASSINLVGHPFPIDGLITVLRSLEKQLPDVWLYTGDLAQPLRQTRYSDLDLSFTALAVRTDAYKYSFFPRTIRDWNSLDTLSWSKLIPQPPVDISCS